MSKDKSLQVFLTWDVNATGLYSLKTVSCLALGADLMFPQIRDLSQFQPQAEEVCGDIAQLVSTGLEHHIGLMPSGPAAVLVWSSLSSLFTWSAVMVRPGVRWGWSLGCWESG